MGMSGCSGFVKVLMTLEEQEGIETIRECLGYVGKGCVGKGCVEKGWCVMGRVCVVEK